MNTLVSGLMLLCLTGFCSLVEAKNVIDYYDVTGFVDFRIGSRTDDDPQQKDSSIGEFRVQLESENELADATLTIIFDFLLDPVLNSYQPDYESGEGIVDPRQLNVLLTASDNVDVKVGRQILTWGTGDLVFINDLFPKDFKSFFIGRDDEYLKAPSDALKISAFSNNVNVDLIYMPVFNADRFVDGARISFYDRASIAARGSATPLNTKRPDKWFVDDEMALRLYHSFSGLEAALYYYNGFWKSPAGLDVLSGDALFPKLQVLGSSLRSPLMAGIVNAEFGYYKSGDEAKQNPLSRNSEYRLLLGYEQEVANELTAGIQYSVEKKLDYGLYLLSLPANSIEDDETRRVITLRLTKLLLQQDLKLSFFNFYSPSDDDGYLRGSLAYKLSDDLKMEVGLNHFYGNESHTFFAQFKNTSNVYSALRYEF